MAWQVNRDGVPARLHPVGDRNQGRVPVGTGQQTPVGQRSVGSHGVTVVVLTDQIGSRSINGGGRRRAPGTPNSLQGRGRPANPARDAIDRGANSLSGNRRTRFH